MTSYLSENEAVTYKMEMFILPKFLTLKWNISRTIRRIEVGVAPFFFIFHALSFEQNFFRPEVPFKLYRDSETIMGVWGHAPQNI